MAVGLDFLSKTKSSGMGSVAAGGASNTQAAGSGSQSSSIFAQNPNSSSSSNKAEGKDMASMNTSDLMKYVYNNTGGKVDIQDKTGEKKDDNKDNVQLPLTVEYGDEKYTSHGKNLDDVVKEISKKTGDSATKVETELKRKYATTKGAKQAGTSLNMQA